MTITVTKPQLHLCPPQSCFKDRTGIFRPRSGFGNQRGSRYRLFVQRCRSFKSEEGEEKQVQSKKENGFLTSFKDVLFGVSNSDYDKAMAKLEEVFSQAAVQIGRYIVTMMSTGVVLAVGFQMSG